MEQILSAYGLPNKAVAVIMTLYKHKKAMVSSLDGNTDFFYIVAGVL